MKHDITIFGILTAIFLLGLVLVMSGCRSLVIPDDPYQAGQQLAEDYLVAQALEQPEAVRASELAYEALSEVVEGPSPTLDQDALETLISDIGRGQGIPQPTINVALIVGKRARRILRYFVGQSPTVRKYHVALSKLKQGIEDRLE